MNRLRLAISWLVFLQSHKTTLPSSNPAKTLVRDEEEDRNVLRHIHIPEGEGVLASSHHWSALPLLCDVVSIDVLLPELQLYSFT